MSGHFQVIETPINVQDVIDKITNRNAGALNLFVGTVREMTGDKQTVYLKYEAYVPMAEKEMARIGEEIHNKWPDAKVAITHRIGELDITDVAVVIAVSTPHRDASFQACRYAIERLKETVPIWKKEHWSDGSEWIGHQQGFPQKRRGGHD